LLKKKEGRLAAAEREANSFKKGGEEGKGHDRQKSDCDKVKTKRSGPSVDILGKKQRQQDLGVMKA